MNPAIMAEVEDRPAENEYPFVLRFAARVISVIFHPLFIPVYLLVFTLFISPVAVALDLPQKARIGIMFSLMYVFFPVVTVLLLKGLGFLKSIMLRTQKERIIPYIACGLYYFWIWYVLHNQPDFPRELELLSLGIFLASSAGLFLNSYFKISMHGLSLGVAMTYLFQLAYRSDAAYGYYLSVALFITGLVSTARLVNSDHKPYEVYAGLSVGILAQMISFLFV